MNISTLLLLLLSFTTLYSTRADQVVLLDTRTATSELNWKSWTNQAEEDAWVEETSYSEEQNVNHRIFSTCDVDHVDIENWLLFPAIDPRNEATRLYVEFGYTIAKCEEIPKETRGCKETMKLFAVTLRDGEQLSSNWFNDTKWEYIETLASKADGEKKHVLTVSYAVTPPFFAAQVYFALKNTGACTAVLYIKIYYNFCSETTEAFVHLPRTLPAADHNNPVVAVQGKCVQNAAPSLDVNSMANNLSQRSQLVVQPPTSICKSDGSWQIVGASRCECNAGFISSLKTSSCTACGVGTYKSARGSGECLQCPEHSTSYRVGSASCECDAGYTRLANESIAYPCKWKRSSFGKNPDLVVIEEPSFNGAGSAGARASDVNSFINGGNGMGTDHSASLSSSANKWLHEILSAEQFWPWLVVCLISALVLCCVLLMISRHTAFNRKQMSDMDALDNYKQDIITPDYSRSLSGQVPIMPSIMNKKLNVPLISAYSTTHCSNLTTGTALMNNNFFKPYVDPTTYEDPKIALKEFTNEISAECVSVTRVIGAGEFGEVCSGRLTTEDVYGQQHEHVVAVKTLLSGSSPKAKADFLTEASNMGQFEHENVIRLLGVVTRTEPVMILTEYMINGSLDNFLKANDGKLEIQQLVLMLHGIACGMKYLTDKGFVHRDLAARNVLVDDRLTCKIADFGLSRGLTNTGMGEQEYTTRNGGKIPIRWTAPEAITHSKYTSASDVWSYGVVMWEVLSYGERPYWDWANHKVIEEVQNGFRLPCPMNAPVRLYEIMRNCWALERHERPTFAQLTTELSIFLNEEYYFLPTPSPQRHLVYGGGGCLR